MDNLQRIDWDDMNALLALAAAGSTAQAAQRMGLSHQTVARRITRLEQRLAAKLIERDATPWRLTALGETVAGQAGQMAKAVAETLSLTRPTGRLCGRISIAGPRWVVTLAVLPALASLRQRHADLQFDLMPEDFQGADLSLTVASGIPPGVSARRIATLGAALYGTPKAVARMEAALASGIGLQRETFSQARPHLIALDNGRAGGGSNITHVRDFEMVVEAVRLGLGVAVLPDAVSRTLPGIVACRAIALPQGFMALWCASDPDSQRVATIRVVEREIFRACRTIHAKAA